jgi:hypothetical protein
VAKEAGAAATVFNLTNGIDAEHAIAIRQATMAYLKIAMAKDWPAMEKETDSSEVTAALSEIYRAVLKYHSFSANEGLVLAEILRQVDNISDARRGRLVMANGIVPGIIWVELFGGAVLTVGFTFFFGAENLRAQAMMTGALSILIFAGLLIIVAVDHPFAGTVKVEPDALAAVVKDFSETAPRP